MTPISIEVVNALIRLSTLPQSALARKCEIQASNLSAALAGERSIPPTKLIALLSLLGVTEEGLLDRSKVHLWKLGAKVEPLRTAMAALCPAGADYTGLWRQGATPFDFRRINDQPLMGITDGQARVILRSEGWGLLVTPQPVNSSTIPSLRHRLVNGQTGVPMLEIPSERFRAWERGEVTVDEFDQLLSTTMALR